MFLENLKQRQSHKSETVHKNSLPSFSSFLFLSLQPLCNFARQEQDRHRIFPDSRYSRVISIDGVLIRNFTESASRMIGEDERFHVKRNLQFATAAATQKELQ